MRRRPCAWITAWGSSTGSPSGCVSKTADTRKAEAWWRARSPDPVPDTAEEAVGIAEAGGVALADSVTVRSVAGERFDEVIDHDLAELPEAVPYAAVDLEDVPFLAGVRDMTELERLIKRRIGNLVVEISRKGIALRRYRGRRRATFSWAQLFALTPQERGDLIRQSEITAGAKTASDMHIELEGREVSHA